MRTITMVTVYRSVVAGLLITVGLLPFAASAFGHWDANPPYNPGLQDFGFGVPVCAKDGALYCVVQSGNEESLMRWTACEGWQTLALIDLQVETLTISKNSLYIGGYFSAITPVLLNSPPISITNVAKMDLATLEWSAVGDGSLNYTVQADIVDVLAVDAQDNVYAG